jgi:hypothetical protein
MGAEILDHLRRRTVAESGEENWRQRVRCRHGFCNFNVVILPEILSLDH